MSNTDNNESNKDSSSLLTLDMFNELMAQNRKLMDILSMQSNSINQLNTNSNSTVGQTINVQQIMYIHCNCILKVILNILRSIYFKHFLHCLKSISIFNFP